MPSRETCVESMKMVLGHCRRMEDEGKGACKDKLDA
jgi:hypothetical protein